MVFSQKQGIFHTKGPPLILAWQTLKAHDVNCRRRAENA
jgi:hypothetical protein